MRPTIGPYDNVLAGTMLFTLVEPHRGHEVAYNRWYERDHFYAGCLIGKGWFAGKRWVATRDLKDRRFPTPSPFIADPQAGSYLSTYWIQKGEDAEAIAWGSEQVKWLHEHDRMYDARDHIHTLMYVLRAATARDEDGVPVALALDHPWTGVVATMVDRAEGTDPRAFTNWLHDECLPSVIAGSSTALAVGATPIPLPPGAPVFQPENPGHEHRQLVLGFLDGDPGDAVSTYEALAEALAASGQGTVSYVAPFRATIVGTDTYTDQLW